MEGKPMRYLFVAVAALVSFSALGQGSATLSWTPPSEYDNGDALNPATDLSGYGVYVDGARSATAPNTAVSFVVSGLGFGPHDIYMTAIATNGNESDMSNTVSVTVVDDRKPRPPTLLQAIIAWLRSVFARFA